MVNFTINNIKYTIKDAERPRLSFPEYEVYDIKMNKGFVTGTHQWDILTIHGNEELKNALLENSGGDMVIGYDDAVYDISICYISTDSDLENDVIKIKFSHALLRQGF